MDKEKVKQKAMELSGSISGATSIMGSWQICHNICLVLVTLLSLAGITVVGMPLLFLTKIALPLWIVAAAFLVISVVIYYKKRCLSARLLVFNSGLLIAGVPFQPVQQFITYFWIAGGIICVAVVVMFIKEKIEEKIEKKAEERTKGKKEVCEHDNK